MKTRARANFSACGEKSTHTRTYSGVPWRSLASLPRMALEVKDGVTGVTSPAYEELVATETKTKGHPLFWRETLDVEWMLAFFRDSHATHIFDLSPGSGAPACAAAILESPEEQSVAASGATAKRRGSQQQRQRQQAAAPYCRFAPGVRAPESETLERNRKSLRRSL